MAIFDFIRVLFLYTDKSPELCVIKIIIMKRKVLRTIFRVWSAAIVLALTLSCEDLNPNQNQQIVTAEKVFIELDDVAKVLSEIPMCLEHLNEVHSAVTSSSDNGYDEEYTMLDLFEAPGRGVGDERLGTRSQIPEYATPLRDLIEEHVRSSVQTKSSVGGFVDPDQFLDALTQSDIQIYWPFSESWDGSTMPIITFDPEDGEDTNIGYRLVVNDDGSRYVEEVIVDEQMAMEVPVWVVNRNSDADHTSLEVLRREDPDWGTGGGTIIVKPQTKSGTSKSLVLKDFTMHRNYDTWFAGASEFFVKLGYIDDFTASTESELLLYNPQITDFMIVVKRKQVNTARTINTVLISDWNEQMSHCALMIAEDDGGSAKEWKCTALVRISSKSYGVEMSLPINSRDDIVWRGQLAERWISAYSGQRCRYGDVSMTLDLVEY